jgi:SdiA-regulated
MINKFFLSLLFMIHCSSRPMEATDSYNFSNPDETIELPESLREVSGIALVSDNLMACVEDEHGVVYFFDLLQKKIIKEITFEKKGDFEDIAIDGETLFILKSNGHLVKISSCFTKPIIQSIHTDLSKELNYEGLAMDKKTLLVGSKSENKIFRYDLTKNKSVGEPIQLPTNGNFSLSGLSVHPISGDYYFLASVGKSLLITGSDGSGQQYVSLSKKIFKQPEGIAFNKSGDLYISNEGKDGMANIQLFKYKKKK